MRSSTSSGGPDGVHVHRASGVTRVALARGAFGVAPSDAPPIVRDAGVTVDVRWDAVPASPGALVGSGH